jgi:hypothetical protein
MFEPLSSRNLARHGMRRGAYDGGIGRRFCLFEKAEHHGERVEIRREFSTKRERDTAALRRLAELGAPLNA